MTESEQKRIKLDVFRGDELPDLCWLKIFEHLNFDERKPLKSLGKRYYQLLNSSRYNKHTTLTFENCVISPLCPPWTIFEQSKIKFRHIILGKNIWLSPDGSLWKKISKTVEIITVKDEPFDKQAFNKLVLNFENLRKVNIPSVEQFCDFRFPKQVEEIYVEKFDILHMRDIINTCELNPQLCENLQEHFDKITMNHTIYGTMEMYHEKAMKISCESLVEDNSYTMIKVSQRIFSIYLTSHEKLPNFEMLWLRTAEHFDYLKNSEPLSKVKSINLSITNETKDHQCSVKNKFPNLISVKIYRGSCVEFDIQSILNDLPKHIQSLNISAVPKFSLNIDFPELVELDLRFYSAKNVESSQLFTKTPSLRKLYLDEAFTIDQGLVDVFPGLQELYFYRELDISQFKFIMKSWPQLQIFLADFRCTKKDIVDAIQDDLTSLQEMDNCWETFLMKKYTEDDEYEMTVFEKIPTLRVFFGKTYKEYCLKKFNILTKQKEE